MSLHRSIGQIPAIPLTNKYTIPVVGLGTYLAERRKVHDAVKHAVDVGYRHFDAAFVYGNEEAVGRALADKTSEGTVSRDELFITSKLWNTFHSRAKVHEGVDVSLQRLGLKYLDLYLIHFPMGYQEGKGCHPGSYSDVDYLETWKAMEEIQKADKTRSIGVSNFHIEQLERILSSSQTVPACNQIEVHVYLQNRKLVDFCKEKGIAVVAHSPLGGEDAEVSGGCSSPLVDPVVKSIAKKHNKEPAQILLKFLLQLGLIVIPKSVKTDRIKSNLQIFDFELEHDDMEQLRRLDKHGSYRATALRSVKDHKFYPFHMD